MEEDEKGWWDKYGWIILLILIVFVLAYAVYNYEKKREEEEQLQLEKRREKYIEILDKRNRQRKWFNIWFTLAFIVARIGIVMFGVFCAYTANWFYDGKVEIDQYLTWLAFLTLCFSAIIFLIIGIPTDVLSTLKKVKPWIKSWIYGKYLGIDEKILKSEKSLKEIEEELDKRISN